GRGTGRTRPPEAEETRTCWAIRVARECRPKPRMGRGVVPRAPAGLLDALRRSRSSSCRTPVYESSRARYLSRVRSSSKPSVLNVLASRYASEAMARLWSPEHKIVLERQLWLAVLRAQKDLGIGVPDGVIEDYERHVHDVDLERIERRERVTRHDVKARIEEFCALAGHEHIHKGMTSRDLTENVEQMQVREALVLLRERIVAALARMADIAAEHAAWVIAGRSHNVPAQATTIGKRIANSGEELLQAYHRLDELIGRYPLRGIKGPVGTQQDMLDLFGSDHEKLARLELRIAEHLGFERVLENVGQVYPRSLDLDVTSALLQAASGPSSFALTLRLMAGAELGTEGVKPGQVGSSAKPHKMNSRACERLHGLK